MKTLKILKDKVLLIVVVFVILATVLGGLKLFDGVSSAIVSKLAGYKVECHSQLSWRGFKISGCYRVESYQYSNNYWNTIKDHHASNIRDYYIIYPLYGVFLLAAIIFYFRDRKS